MPNPERALWYYLRNNNLKGYKFRRQYSVGNYIVDFYCPELRLAIEVDGDSHFQDKAGRYDSKREQKLQEHNIKTVRFTNREITGNVQSVVEEILRYLP